MLAACPVQPAGREARLQAEIPLHCSCQEDRLVPPAASTAKTKADSQRPGQQTIGRTLWTPGTMLYVSLARTRTNAIWNQREGEEAGEQNSAKLLAPKRLG